MLTRTRVHAFARIDERRDRPARAARLTTADAMRLTAAQWTLADFAHLWRRAADQEPCVFLPCALRPPEREADE
jgi:hypothetical protein